MESIRQFFESAGGKVTALVLLLAGGYLLYRQIHVGSGAAMIEAANERPFVCSETLKGFDHELVKGETIPIYSPYSGKNTGYPAELCYWNKDGTAKSTPTYVLLNKWIGKPGPTFCPDCGRLVTVRNPMPGPGVQPPPTEQEYWAMHDSRE